jgi:hypothetical protein
MKAIKYIDGTPVITGDVVEIRRRLRSSLRGRVVYVYDATRPVERDTNDYGFAVRLEDGGRERWYGSPPDASVSLSGRSKMT